MSPTKPKPSKIPPVLVAALVCDCGVMDPGSGKKSVIGIFSQLNVAKFPASRPVTLYFKLSDAEGFYPLDIQFVHLNTDHVIAEVKGEVQIPNRIESHDVLINLPPLPFNEVGRYEFRIHASGMFLGAAFLDVVLIGQ